MVHVVPRPHCGQQKLCTIRTRAAAATVVAGGGDVPNIRSPPSSSSSSSSREEEEEYWFEYQKIHFCYVEEKTTTTTTTDDNDDDPSQQQRRRRFFQRLAYPEHETLQYYLQCKGYHSKEDLALAFEKWGQNVFHIPMPSFGKLFSEQAIAPFFVFQVCVCMYIYITGR